MTAGRLAGPGLGGLNLENRNLVTSMVPYEQVTNKKAVDRPSAAKVNLAARVQRCRSIRRLIVEWQGKLQAVVNDRNLSALLSGFCPVRSLSCDQI